MTLYGKSNGFKASSSVSASATGTDAEESEYTNEYDEDSGNEDDEDLDASEEIILPEDEDEEEDEELNTDEEIFRRQLAYPPLPDYIPPSSWTNTNSLNNNISDDSEGGNSTKYVAKRINPRERLGVLTPMEEVTEPPSSAGTEASGIHRSKNRKRSISTTQKSSHSKSRANKKADVNPNNSKDKNVEQKSSLKSKPPQGSPDRRVKFVGAGSTTASERTVSPTESLASNTSEYSSLAESARKSGTNKNNRNNNAIPEETEEDENEIVESDGEELSDKGGKNRTANVPVMEQLEKVESWQLGSDNETNNDVGFPSASFDSEFASILDDIIAELHSWDRLAGTGAGITEINASRQDHLANISSQLTSYMGQVRPATIMANLPQLIPLITSLLSLTESSFRAQLTSLNTVNVFAERLKDCKAYSGLKVLPNADLTWLLRTLCDISSESSRSVLKTVGTSTLATLVKAAGPEMICEPILFILMGNDEKIIKKANSSKGREGSGNIVTTGVPGGAPKIKATALDTLTFALLTFPRDDFELDVVAKLACHCLIHPKRRVRQAALECLAVVAHALGPKTALPMFRLYISEEEEAIAGVNASNSSMSSTTSGSCSTTISGSTTSTSETGTVTTDSNPDAQLDNPRLAGPPSKIPVPIKALEASQKSQPASPKKTLPSATAKGPTPSSAVSARVSRHILPTPNLEELVEYGVKIPANSQLLSRQTMKIGGQDYSDEYGSAISSINSRESGSVSSRPTGRDRLSSSGESCSSISNIEYSFLELEPVLNSNGSGGLRRKGAAATAFDFATDPDVAWILNGSGPVKKCDPATVLPRELNSVTRPKTNQQWNNFSNSSGTESDFNNITSSQRINSDFEMRRVNSRGDLLQDTAYNIKEPSLGRYYYPPNVSPRGAVNQTENLSRYSTKSSYNLLPNKYSIIRNNGHATQYRGGGGHDLISHHAPLPGAYDSHFGPTNINGYSSNASSTNWSHGLTELGSISRVPSKAKPLEPITSLKDKFLDSSRRNVSVDGSREQIRSDSRQSASTEEEESETENDKTESNKPYRSKPFVSGGGQSKNQNMNKNARKPPTGRSSNYNTNGSNNNGNGSQGKVEQMKLHNKGQDQLTSIKQDIFANGVNREFQVYHHRIEVDSTPNVATTTVVGKRGDADSAGSNHTRDSGVSLGSVAGSKTPPSAHNTPPSQHRNPSPTGVSSRSSGGRKSSKPRQTDNSDAVQLHRNWRSTPDVPLVLASDNEEEAQFEGLRRDRSGSSSNSINQNSQNQNLRNAQGSTSEANMHVHRKPVLARRGQSVTRSGISDSNTLPTPQLRYPDRSIGQSKTRNDSGDNYYEDEYNRRMGFGNDAYIYGMDDPHSESQLRNSVSTGNLIGQSESNGRFHSHHSKSTYFEIRDEEVPETPRTGRVSRREGPFGDVRAVVDEDIIGPRVHHSTSMPHTLPMRKNGAKINGKIVPTKVYKGSFREVNSRKASNGGQTEVFPADLKPVTSPKHALPMALGQLQSTDWETNVAGFRQIVRMIRFHPDAIRADLHNINMTGIKHLTNLRSQVCRSAILCFKELFTHLGRSMEADSERIAEKLLDKSSDTNKFIREDSGKAMEAMMTNLTPVKGLTCLDLFGTRHRNPAVRGMAARLTATLVEVIGPDRALAELPERLLPMLCKFLQEGSLETRTSAKTAMSTLMTHHSFYTQLKRYVPSDVLRHAQKSIDALQK